MEKDMHYDDSPSEGKVLKNFTKNKLTICILCKSFVGFNKSGEPMCEAFPGGIPNKFWSGKVDHTTPYDGDNGITFQPFTS